jgi:5-methylcytosine-specific restriction endonuclease McrA
MRQIRAAMIRHAVANGQPCEVCARPMRYGEKPALDHRIPLALGGPNTPDNWTIVHSRCNGSKGAKLPGSVPAWRR